MEADNGSGFISEKELPAEIEEKEKHDSPTDQTAEAETASPAVENAKKLTAKPSNAAARSVRTRKPVSKLSTPAKTSATFRVSTVRSAPVTAGSRPSLSTASRTKTVDNNGNSPAVNGVQTSLTSVSSSKAAVSANAVTKRNSNGSPVVIAERRANIGTPAAPRQRPSTTASTPAKPISPSVAETRGASTKSVASSNHAEPKKSPAPLASKSSSSSLKSPSPAGSSKPLNLSTRSSPKPTENAVRHTAMAKPSVLPVPSTG